MRGNDLKMACSDKEVGGLQHVGPARSCLSSHRALGKVENFCLGWKR